MIVRENIALRDYTTFKIGGTARYFVEATNDQDVIDAIAFAREKSVPYFILGGGSNTLVSDDGFAGLIILILLKGIAREDALDGKTVSLTVSAGEDWDKFVAHTVENNLWGLENLSGIPGTVGAAPVQNIGAYGTEAKETIESVRIYDPEMRTVRDIKNAECEFGYRTSIWKRAHEYMPVILSVTFRLSCRAKPNLVYKDIALYFERENITHPSLVHIREAVLEIRAGKFLDMRAVGTAGSFWKNPTVSVTVLHELESRLPGLPSFPVSDSQVKLSLAWILDRVCGLKGHAHGRASLYEHQPLVLIAFPGCTSFEIESLAAHVSKIVHDKTGVMIEREVFFLRQ
ncbi:MAG: UDP-N-acetylenolpyruvoylglucosamine reductase [Candidatus Taylorbacteria bacterium CG10_big_fil_rev_8_21_14_0_10_41_48]|uniref:UDP-N-acetylenolpyruvoylglucosamine reductase n=1 Tax=Candidatus Taylorbacteria bacterium CG10_big_fil_rev_8_21_14_0_10_41_48 TaxID=1975024 RepID=A0A2M8LBA4_9BACT|nr:MAG: UDP-N-acetylenolpyruvoylglucosamine reductase [Candidatus Taylorbacteria bacterium CG10_big_fil_rev_8_21_14_0_10_41_48]